MKQMTDTAYAKINLTLDVLNLRPDGYHEVDMVMQSVSLSDTVTITTTDSGKVAFTCQRRSLELPTDRSNLAVDAAYHFHEATGIPMDGMVIGLVKRIPVCAGTGGGSSDAAAVLRALNRLTEAGLSQEQLMEIGARIGSDVPYCVMGGTARARGRGELLERLPSMPDCFLVLCKPDFSISTPELFHRMDQYPPSRHPQTERMLSALEEGNVIAITRLLYNVFEEVLPLKQQREVRVIREILADHGALGACMSGTGPTIYGIFDREELANKAYRYLQDRYGEVFLARPV